MAMELNEDELRDLYKWVDAIPLSKPKKNINRDFSDGVQVAEIVKFYFPSIVDLHNYPVVNNTEQRKGNWRNLNSKVFKKLRFKLEDDVIERLVTASPGVIENVLFKLRRKIDQALWYLKNNPAAKGGLRSEMTEADSGGAYLPRLEAFDPYDSTRAKPGVPAYKTKRSTSIERIDNEALSRQDLSVGPGKPSPATLTGQSSSQFISGPDSQMVSTLMYQEKVQDALAKDETIKILEAKIKRLEHLLHIKNDEIDQLQHSVDDLRPTAAIAKQQQQRKVLHTTPFRS